MGRWDVLPMGRCLRGGRAGCLDRRWLEIGVAGVHINRLGFPVIDSGLYLVV